MIYFTSNSFIIVKYPNIYSNLTREIHIKIIPTRNIFISYLIDHIHLLRFFPVVNWIRDGTYTSYSTGLMLNLFLDAMRCYLSYIDRFCHHDVNFHLKLMYVFMRFITFIVSDLEYFQNLSPPLIVVVVGFPM